MLEEDRMLQEANKVLVEDNDNQLAIISRLTHQNKSLVAEAERAQRTLIADRVSLAADVMTTRIFNISRVKQLAEELKDESFDPSLTSWDKLSEKRIQDARKHPALQPEAIKAMPADIQTSMQAFYASSSSGTDTNIQVPSLHSGSRNQRHRIAHTVDSHSAATILSEYRHLLTDLFGVPLIGALESSKEVSDGQNSFAEAHKAAAKAKSKPESKKRQRVQEDSKHCAR
ncbi:unnamed protein product [Sympodiomycopsis kandeliae]